MTHLTDSYASDTQRQQFGLRGLFVLIGVCSLHFLLFRLYPVAFFCILPSSLFAGIVARIRFTTDHDWRSTLRRATGITTLAGFAFASAIATAFMFFNNVGLTLRDDWAYIVAMAALGAFFSLFSSILLAACIALVLWVAAVTYPRSA